MKIITELKEASWEKSAIAIGKFEGLHMGHQKLIKKIVEKQRAGYVPVAFTFDKSPRVYFGAGEGVLFTKEERRALFEAWGVGCLVECPFHKEMASMEAEEFVEKVLCGMLHAAYLVVGPDFCFGRNRTGDVKLLQKYEQEGRFALEIIEKEEDNKTAISSTRIRQSLVNGQMEELCQMLGFPYFLEGEVVKGNQLGRTWGIPTANIMVNQMKLFPPNGVSFSRIVIDEKIYCGITNIGTKPTIGDDCEKNVETYIYDFSEEIYGKYIKIQLLRYHRPEQRFESIQGLVAALQQDLQCGKEYFFP